MPPALLLPILLRWFRRAMMLLLVAAALLIAFVALRPAPQDLPWTPLKLDEPIGLFTGRKIARLTADRPACFAVLRASGIDFTPAPARGEGRCVVEDGVQIAPRARLLPIRPANVRPSCPVAAGLIAWHTHIVQPAALGILGVWVKRIEHLGSYSCRRLYGRSDAGWSEHATADAIDISGFVLSDGTRISVLKDWDDAGNKGAFLRAVRDGGCRVFSTVLSPDYNAAHADHLHMDQAARGATGWRSCR